MDWLKSVVGKEDKDDRKEREDKEFDDEDGLEDDLGLKDGEVLTSDLTEVIKVLDENPPKPPELTEEEMKEYMKFIDRMENTNNHSKGYSGKNEPKTNK